MSSEDPDKRKVFRVIAHGRVKGQNPKLDYFRNKFHALDCPFWKLNLLQKKFPTAGRRGGSYKIKMTIEGYSDDLPHFIRNSKDIEETIASFLHGLRLKGWRLYRVLSRKIKNGGRIREHLR